jgi:hypothetical protein
MCRTRSRKSGKKKIEEKNQSKKKRGSAALSARACFSPWDFLLGNVLVLF